MFHQSRNTARVTMGAIGLLALLFLLTTFGSVSPALAASSLQDAYAHQAAPLPGTDAYFAGYTATAPGTYTAAQVDFTVPNLIPGGGPQVAYAAAVGTKAAGIIDAGIYSYLDPSGNQVNKAYWEFYSESFGRPQKGDFSLTGGEGVVRPNDQIRVSVSSNSNGESFTIEDFTANSTGFYRLPVNNPDGYTNNPDGIRAGCIVLIPIGTSQPPADFGTVNFTGCEVARSDNPVLSAIGNYQPDSHQISRQVNGGVVDDTSYPTALVSDTPSPAQDFSVTWENAQPQGN